MNVDRYRHALSACYLLLTVCIFVPLLTTGCSRDCDCECDYPPAIDEIDEQESLLFVKVIDAEGKDISDKDEVESVTLYLFDPAEYFYEQITVPSENIKSYMAVKVPKADIENYWVVAWGNLKEAEIVAEATEGSRLRDLTVMLKEENGYGISPDDLFFGFKQLGAPEPGSNVFSEDIFVSRKNARMYITVWGDITEDNASEYYFTVEKKSRGYYFNGDLCEGDITLRQAGVFRPDLDGYVTPEPLNVLHTVSEEQCMTVNLYRESPTRSGASLILSVTEDMNGELLTPEAGETTNILIDLTQGSNPVVTTQVTPWNEIYTWKRW